MDDVSFGCLVPFPDQSSSFVLGFEAGALWLRMEQVETPIEFMGMPCHAENEEVFRRMAAARGYDLHIELRHGEWITGCFDKRRRAFTVIDGGV